MVDIVEIEILDPVLKEHYGSTMRLHEDRAVSGERRGKWRIISERSTGPEYGKIPIQTPVSIIILCWNNLQYTKKCIESIRKNTELNYQLVIIDNGSTDGTSQYAETILNGRDVLIRSNENIGFSSGNNLGSRVAVGERLLFLNNDCEVGPAWFEQLMMASEDAGLVGPSLRSLTPDHQNKTFGVNGAAQNPDNKWSYLEAWCLLIKKKDFLSIGGFDIQFDPCLSEDADLSFRCRETGLKIKNLSNLPVVHQRSKSIKMHENVQAISTLNNVKLYKKWVESGRLAESTPAPQQVPKSSISGVYERVILTEL